MDILCNSIFIIYIIGLFPAMVFICEWYEDTKWLQWTLDKSTNDYNYFSIELFYILLYFVSNLIALLFLTSLYPIHILYKILIDLNKFLIKK